MVSDFHSLERVIKKLGYDEGDELYKTFEIPEIKYKKVTREKELEREIGKILHASSNLLWEEQYDASKSEPISWSVPCAELIETLHLRQLKYDGSYYDETGKLAAFDTKITQQHGGVVVRKDLLDKFLNDREMKLIWILNARKEIQVSNLGIAKWSKWTGLLSYDKTNIKCNVNRVITKE